MLLARYGPSVNYVKLMQLLCFQFSLNLEGNGDTHSYFISLYWTVGKIIEGLGHFEEVMAIGPLTDTHT